MGGSMHIFDGERRFMGGYAIVGESCSIAIGIAYAVVMRNLPETVICFFGDGAMNQGAFHEALNMAGLWHLPVLFGCENNHYAIGTEVHRHSALPDLYKRVAAYKIPAEKVDGMDVLKVYDAASRALDHVRRGDGPQFLECETYRYRGHSTADPGTYRPAVELKAYQAHDPLSAAIRELEFRYPTPEELAAAGPNHIARLGQHLLDTGHARKAEVDAIKADVNNTVEDAVQYALNTRRPPWKLPGRHCAVTGIKKS